MKKSLRVAIYGSGSIGLDLGVHLIEGGHEVTFIARNETFEALCRDGIEFRSMTEPSRTIASKNYRAVDSAHNAGVQDIIFLTTKADVLLEVASLLEPLFKQSTIVISATNGIPPWYSYLQEQTIGRFLQNTIPRETFLHSVGAERLIGAVVERGIKRIRPTEVVHLFGRGYRIGEPSQVHSERLELIRQIMNDARLDATITTNIHRDIWVKLIGNICVNPLSVLAEKNIGQLLVDKTMLCEMQLLSIEGVEVGTKLGVIEPSDFKFDAFVKFMEDNLAHHEPSMLQDYKRGRPLEIDRIVEVVIMLAGLSGVDIPVPTLRSVYKSLQSKVMDRS